MVARALLSLGRLSLGRLSLGGLSLGRLSLGRLSLGRLSLGRLSLGGCPWPAVLHATWRSIHQRRLARCCGRGHVGFMSISERQGSLRSKIAR